MSITAAGVGFRVSRADTYNPTVTQTGGADVTNLDIMARILYQDADGGWTIRGAAVNLKSSSRRSFHLYQGGFPPARSEARVAQHGYRTSMSGPTASRPDPAPAETTTISRSSGGAGKMAGRQGLGAIHQPAFSRQAQRGKGTCLSKGPRSKPAILPATDLNDVSNELTGNQSSTNRSTVTMSWQFDLGKLSVTGGVRVETTKTRRGCVAARHGGRKARRAAYDAAMVRQSIRVRC